MKEHKNILREFINIYVISAYIIYLIVSVLVILLMRKVPISYIPLSDIFGYGFIAILSLIFFGEKLSRYKILGLALIAFGAVIYSL